MITRNTSVMIAAVFFALLLFPLSVQAGLYTWAGTVSANWTDANWTGGTNTFPNSYSDQATIPSSTTHNAVSLTATTIFLGGGTATTGLNLGNITGLSLDIPTGGLLGMQANIASRKPIDLEGVLRNDAPSSATTYTVTGSGGSIVLNGGTVSSLNGGIWSFSQAVTGNGVITAPFTGTGAVTANSVNLPINISGTNVTPLTLSTITLSYTTAFGTATGTGYDNLSYLNVTGLTLSGTSGRSQFTNPLPGTFGNNWGNASGAYGLLNVTGNSTINGTIGLSGGYKVFNITNSTLTLNNPGVIPTAAANTSAPPAFVLGTGGNLNISGSVSFPSTSAPIPLNGGSLTQSGGAFSAYAFIGWGSVSGVTNIGGGGSVLANGGSSVTSQTLTFATGAGGATLGSHSGSGANLNSATYNTLDLQGTYNYLNPASVNPSGGTVQLDGATLNTYDPTALPSPTTYTINLNPGTITVVNDSTLIGSFNSTANLGVNPSKTLNVSGTILNSATVAVGAGTLNNIAATASTISGAGSVTIAGGSVASSGGGGLVSTNTLSGYGNVTAPLTNNGKVIANGNGNDANLLNLSGPVSATLLNPGSNGWYAANHGKLVLPSLAITTTGTEYDWGGPSALNLVNSVAVNVDNGGLNSSGNLLIALLAPERTEVPAGLINPIGIWDFEQTGGLSIAAADLTFRYDNVAAAPLPTLNLYHWDGAAWDLVPTVPGANPYTLFASGVTSFSPFALAQSVVPEPTTLALLAAGCFALVFARKLNRRRLSL